MPLPPTERSSSSARATVLPRLALCAREFPDITVRGSADGGEDGPLDARDASLARAIEQTVLRRWSTLRAIVTPCIDRDWSNVEPKLQGALLAGTAQLTLLERVPDHAAIDESIVREFLEDRMDSLEDLEALALELESQGETESLGSIWDVTDGAVSPAVQVLLIES